MKKRYNFQCLTCKYLVIDTAWQQAKFDYDCPRCRQTTVSRFVPVEVKQ